MFPLQININSSISSKCLQSHCTSGWGNIWSISEVRDDPHVEVMEGMAGGLANALLCGPWQLLVVGSNFTDDETKTYRVSVTSQGDTSGKRLGRNSKLVCVKADPPGGIVISSLLGTYFPQDPT